jgi:hypothetical protein
MDERNRHVALDYGRLVLCISALVFAIFFAVLVVWVVVSKQDSKLYEADNVVCVSQPFAVQCFERKPR